MNFKNTGAWVLAIVAISVLFVGRLTDFTFKNLEVQLHDTYYVFDPFTVILITSITLGLVSMAVTSSKLLRNQHLLLRVILILIVSGMLLIPVLMLYMFMLMRFAR